MSNVNVNHDLWCDNWRTYEKNLADKYLYEDYLTRAQIRMLYREHPQLLIEILTWFSTWVKERVAQNPTDTFTMSYVPQKDGKLEVGKDKRFDLIDAIDAISEALAKQLDYKGWVE